jgi:precorrin-6A/cobalt-precorrin-6A reductase
VGAVLIGGFGGTAGLVSFLLEHRIDAVIDATHPFARTMTEHAVAATAETRVPLLIVRRPGWVERDGDQWHRVDSVGPAAVMARKLSAPGDTVFVTTGRRELAPFAADDERHYLIRTVDEPQDELPVRHTVLRDRGPYTLEGELGLMRSHNVRVLVTKDSGGAMTIAKLDAARTLQLPVVMVDRPALPSVGLDEVTTVADAVAWCGG